MHNDISWEIMLQAMWKNQWTRKRTELTEELRNTLYDESQGIIDIAVKLYTLAQMKVMADRTEVITANDIKEVAAVNLIFVKEMLNALRSGDVKKLAKYEDIMPINVEEYISAQAARLSVSMLDFSREETLSLEEQVVLKLLEMGIPSKIARTSVRKIISKSTVGQPLSAVIKKAFRLALNMEGEKEQPDIVEEANDLRNTAGGNSYENLKNSGNIAEDADEF